MLSLSLDVHHSLPSWPPGAMGGEAVSIPQQVHHLHRPGPGGNLPPRLPHHPRPAHEREEAGPSGQTAGGPQVPFWCYVMVELQRKYGSSISGQVIQVILYYLHEQSMSDSFIFIRLYRQDMSRKALAWSFLVFSVPQNGNTLVGIYPVHAHTVQFLKFMSGFCCI